MRALAVKSNGCSTRAPGLVANLAQVLAVHSVGERSVICVTKGQCSKANRDHRYVGRIEWRGVEGRPARLVEDP